MYDNYFRNLEMIARGGGSEQARFYRGDYDWFFKEVGEEEEGKDEDVGGDSRE